MHESNSSTASVEACYGKLTNKSKRRTGSNTVVVKRPSCTFKHFRTKNISAYNILATEGKKVSDAYKDSQTIPTLSSQSSILPTKNENKVKQNMRSSFLKETPFSLQNVSDRECSNLSKINQLGFQVPKLCFKRNEYNQQSSNTCKLSGISENQMSKISFRSRIPRRRGTSVVSVSRQNLRKPRNKFVLTLFDNNFHISNYGT